MTLVDVDTVSWKVDDRAIVDRIALSIAPNEFVGLVGPNGSGKSSLLRTIYRVIKPTAGVVRLDGDDVWQMPARTAARRMAVVGQESHGEFDFSVREIVMMGRSPHKAMLERDNARDNSIVDDVLARVNMAAFADRAFSTLSGGEKQRALLARALAQQPRFLILDEPTNHLDVRYQLELLSLVKGLKITTIAALHDLNLAAQYCDRIVMLEHGRVVASGSPREVFDAARIAAIYCVHADVIHHPRTGHLMITFLPLATS
jgi:iron complex transport system ATP-binding protein